MNKNKYTLKEYLAVKGISGLKIKKSYTLQDMLRAKKHLSGSAGNCHIYDPQLPVLVRGINKVLNKHNMVWVINRKRKGGKVYRGWDKIVRLDDTLPLPDSWEEILGEFVGPSGAMGKIIEKLYASGKLIDSDMV
jgi:hypothetical protein